MLDPENYKDYSDITVNEQPRVSYLFGNMSRKRIIDYAEFLLNFGEQEKAKIVLHKINELMPVDVYPLTSDIENKLKEISGKL